MKRFKIYFKFKRKLGFYVSAIHEVNFDAPILEDALRILHEEYAQEDCDISIQEVFERVIYTPDTLLLPEHL